MVDMAVMVDKAEQEALVATLEMEDGLDPVDILPMDTEAPQEFVW